MGNTSISLGAGDIELTGQHAKLRVLRDLAFDTTKPRYHFVLTYLVASAGLTPVYDAKTYPDFLKDVAGIFPGITAADARADLSWCVKQARAGSLPTAASCAVTLRHARKYGL